MSNETKEQLADTYKRVNTLLNLLANDKETPFSIVVAVGHANSYLREAVDLILEVPNERAN